MPSPGSPGYLTCRILTSRSDSPLPATWRWTTITHRPIDPSCAESITLPFRAGTATSCLGLPSATHSIRLRARITPTLIIPASSTWPAGVTLTRLLIAWMPGRWVWRRDYCEHADHFYAHQYDRCAL